MLTYRFVALIVIFSLFWASVFGQTSPTELPTEKDEAREKLEKDALKLVDKAIGEIDSLKLWENRALALAIAGDLVWKTDQKRARQLFRNSADELVRATYQPKEKARDYNEEYNYWRDDSPRHMILLMIASHDANLALTLLKETRPPELQVAIDAQNRPNVAGQDRTSVEVHKNEANTYKVRKEIRIEQSFAVKAAEQDPKKAAKLIRESLAKGVSFPAIILVNKVYKKDEELGKELLNEIINKLLDSPFNENFSGELQVAQYLLEQDARPEFYKRMRDFTPLKLEAKDLKAIANKVADYYIQSKSNRSFRGLSRSLPILEKYVPEKISLLQQKEKEIRRLMPESSRARQNASKMMNDPNIGAEKLIAEAKNQTSWQKYEFYRRAIDKFIEKGEGEKGRQLLKNEAMSKQREDALNYLNTRLSQNAIKDDKLKEAQALIDQSETISAKISMLVNLAIGFEKKNTEESHKNAVRLMEEAIRLVNQFPENREEVSDILKVASGFAVVDPEKAFPYLNNLIYMANDLMTAYALIGKYNKKSNLFKKGEIIFSQNAGGSFAQYGKELGSLAKADFDKTAGLIDQFQRPDVRTLAKLLLARSILKENILLEGNILYRD